MWDLWSIKWHRVRISPTTSVSTAIILPTTPQSTIVSISGWNNRPNRGRHTNRVASPQPTNVLNLAPRYEEVWESGGIAARILQHGVWPASRPSRFTPEEKTPGTHSIVWWAGSRISLTQWQREYPCTHQESNRQYILTVLTELSRIISAVK
jgi:hypothetical protein